MFYFLICDFIDIKHVYTIFEGEDIQHVDDIFEGELWEWKGQLGADWLVSISGNTYPHRYSINNITTTAPQVIG